jgi:hypothetical protein
MLPFHWKITRNEETGELEMEEVEKWAVEVP